MCLDLYRNYKELRVTIHYVGHFITIHLLTLQKLQVNAAVAAAKEAFPDWSSCSPEHRAQVLNKLADLIEANLDEFAQAESKDQGLCVSWCVLLCLCVSGQQIEPFKHPFF